MIKKLHHVAYRCVDAAETAEFYEKILGLRLAAALVQDYVPSLGENDPHNHIFFEMEDGSFIAFFDVLNDREPASPRNPDWAQHLALEVESHDKAQTVIGRLQDAGVSVIGPVSHGMCDSYYFYDPSGHRIELSVRTDDAEMWNGFARQAPEQMKQWSERKMAQ